MSWSPEVFIGEFRPWPDSVHVVRGRTGETVRYMPEQTCANKAKYYRDFECSECADYWPEYEPNTFHYCPNCGAKVVE